MKRHVQSCHTPISIEQQRHQCDNIEDEVFDEEEQKPQQCIFEHENTSDIAGNFDNLGK